MLVQMKQINLMLSNKKYTQEKNEFIVNKGNNSLKRLYN